MMNCRELEHLLSPYLDGELDASERVVIEQHLASCQGCAGHVEVQRHNLSLIRAAAREGSPAAPEALRAKVLGRLRVEERQSFRHRAVRWSALAASVAVVAATAHHEYRVFLRRRYVEDAALRHARQLPLEIQQPSPEQLEAWFRGKLDHPVSVPRFVNATAAGARLLNVREKPAAYIRYDAARSDDARPRQVGLFVIDDDDQDIDVGALPQPNLGSSNGYNVVSWRNGDLTYILTSDLDEGDIRQLLPPSGSARPAAALKPSLDVQPASLQR